MALSAFAPLRRRKRQLDTLRVMLAGVQDMLELADKLANERELTADELQEVEALEVRHERIKKGIDETEQLLSATGVHRA